MDELDVFRSFNRDAARPSEEAHQRAWFMLAGAMEREPAHGDRVRRSRRRRRFVVVAVAALVVALASTSAFGTVRDLLVGSRRSAFTLDAPTWSPDGRRIAFGALAIAGGQWGPFEYYVMNADGSGLRNLTRELGLPASPHGSCPFPRPEWSPNWRQLALVPVRGPDCRWQIRSQIYVMNADGTGLRRLTWSPHGDGDLAWSPDGRRIAFARIRGHLTGISGGRAEIYVVNADGSGLRRLAHGIAPALQAGAPSPGLASHPAWSPDGRRIAFVSNRDGNHDIFVVDADGGGLRNLTRSRRNHRSLQWWGPDGPQWSPDGRTIAFRSDRDGNDEIYVVNADGTELRRLTHNSKSDGGPLWSPDGRRILFWRSNNPPGYGIRGDVWVMNADGSGERNLTRNAAHPFATDSSPAWSPDGRKILFVSDRDGNGEVYVMNADGSRVRKLTHLNGQN
jgi:Tol biopolymer transport system component